MKEKVFENEVYEQQRKNIENLYKENPNNWFYKMEMEKKPQFRVGFAPLNGICTYCGKDITGVGGITLKTLGNDIITGCPFCHKSYCD